MTALALVVALTLGQSAARSGTQVVGNGTKVQATGSSFARTLAARFAETINVKDFGAVGDGTTDDAAAIDAAFTAANAAAGSIVFFPAGTYRRTTAFSIPAYTTVKGEGSQSTKILRAFVGDFVTSFGAYAVLDDIQIDGGSTGAGRGVLIPSGQGGQKIDRSVIRRFSEPCLEFAADGGAYFSSTASDFVTTGALGTVASVKVNGTDSAAVPRAFHGPSGQGTTLFDFGGASDFFATNFYSNGLIYGAAANKVMLDNVRLGDAAAVTLNGGDHLLRGISAIAITVNATGSVLDIQAPSWAITDSGSGNSILMVSRSFTPTLTNAGGATLGNATVASRWSRQGRRVTVEYDITWGNTSSAGTGSLALSLPVAANSQIVQAAGSALAVNAGSTTFAVAVPRVVNSASEVTFWGNAGPFTSAVPFAWTTGDILRASVTYTVP